MKNNILAKKKEMSKVAHSITIHYDLISPSLPLFDRILIPINLERPYPQPKPEP